MTNSWSSDARVAVVRQESTYEVPLVERTVGEALSLLGESWESMVRPGETVLIKPNLIRQGRTTDPSQWEQIITNPAVIAAVAKGVARAMDGKGAIRIADAPQTDSDFEAIAARTGLIELRRWMSSEFPGLQFEVLDLRREAWLTDGAVIRKRRQLPDAPGGYTLVDLGQESAFSQHRARYYGADYDIGFTNRHHCAGRHEYLLARAALDADLFINLPKLKTHKKVGVTMSLKNLVGINGDKNYLPHYALGTPEQGGDEFPNSSASSRLQSQAITAFKQTLHRFPWISRAVGHPGKLVGAALFGPTERTIRSGNWHGNDTAWRMVLDLNRILFHFDGSGRRRTQPLRYLSIVDGIIGGEGDGPMNADPVASGVLLAGFNPVAVDMIGATFMGFDWRKIPTIREAFATAGLPLADFSAEDVHAIPELGRLSAFRPHMGWVAEIELRNQLVEASL